MTPLPREGPEAKAGVRIGDVLAGKYRVDGVLGVGGMGVVVAAHHLQLDERVALKFLLPTALSHALGPVAEPSMAPPFYYDEGIRVFKKECVH